MKKCNTCGQTLPLEDFHKRTYASGNVGHQHKCKKCYTKVRGTYYKPHENMRRKLNLSDELYEELMQKDNCDTCGRVMTKKCIDHDHVTGKVRGVLCNNCNTALGLVKDNVDTLKNMILYVSKE